MAIGKPTFFNPKAVTVAIRATCLLLLFLDSAGCVRRRMTIRSNPPGAVVRVDNYEIGRTPCSVDFTYYGTRTIQLEMPGYETLTVEQPFQLPWYQLPPVDFVTENLLPTEIRDERALSFQLIPQVIVPTDSLLARAENLRRGSRIEGYEAVLQPEATDTRIPAYPLPLPSETLPGARPGSPWEQVPPGRGAPAYESLPPGGRPLFDPP